MNVYLISDGNGVKIGKANNISFRLQELQSGNSKPLTILHSIHCNSNKESLKLERILHQYFSEVVIGREWYKLTADDVLFVKQVVNRNTTYNKLLAIASTYKNLVNPNSHVIGYHKLPSIDYQDSYCESINTEEGRNWYKLVVKELEILDVGQKELMAELANLKFKLEE
jgi:hypothetical protein